MHSAHADQTTTPDSAPPQTEYVLTFVCEDRPGIVHAVTGAVVEIGGKITESRQFESGSTHRFYLRLPILAPVTIAQLESAIAPVVERCETDHRGATVGRPRRPLILANHDTMGRLAEYHSVPFEHRPIKDSRDKAAFEDRVREAVAEHDIELVVLARYMQILSPELCEELEGRCINIHHSFLPGFKGANPYRQAHARGVKQIGATAHFVTSDLDEGPIVEQDVTRVDHTRSPQELMVIGQDAEV